MVCNLEKYRVRRVPNASTEGRGSGLVSHFGWLRHKKTIKAKSFACIQVCICACVHACVRACPSTRFPLGFPVSSDLYQIKGDANIRLHLGPLQRSSLWEWRSVAQTPGENSCQSSRPPLISNLKGLSPAADSPQQTGSASTSHRPLTAPFRERLVMNLISPKSLSPHHTPSSSHFPRLTLFLLLILHLGLDTMASLWCCQQRQSFITSAGEVQDEAVLLK